MLQDVVLASIVAVPLVGLLASHAVSPRGHGEAPAGRWGGPAHTPRPLDPSFATGAAAWYPPAVNLAVYVSTSERGEPEVLAGTIVAPAGQAQPVGVQSTQAHAAPRTGAYGQLVRGALAPGGGSAQRESLDVLA